MADDLVIGGQLGNYLIESVIGRGGMSVVYRAKHARLGTSVALKVLAPELSSDDTFRERFLREAQMAAGIDHPNVVPIHDLGLHDNSLYIVMRYIAGGDLKSLLATSGPMDPEQALFLLEPAAQALDAAHERGLVHRDVKPGNILIQQAGGEEVEHVYLTDFGIAKSSHVSGLTRAGGLIGTVEYMAPEQVEGHPVSAQTDVYALAGVFYECVTGRIPYEREIAEGAFPPLGTVLPVTRLRPGLPAALDDVLAKALSRTPSERYGSCEEFIHACRQALASQGAAATAAGAATVADQHEPARETVATTSGSGWPESAPPAREAGQSGGDAWQPLGDPPPAPPAPPPPSRDRGPGGRDRRPFYIGGGLVTAAAIVVAVVLASSSSSKKPAAAAASNGPATSSLAPVPTNRATGTGTANVRLEGNTATVTVTTASLDNNASLVHPFHIHAGGKGQCPPASAARPHNGHVTISTTDGINYYGPPAASLTTSGDTSPSSILAFSRYLTGGTLRYTRTIALPEKLANQIRQNNAVIVIHGVDYDHTGFYTGVLDRSELNKAVPATATAPALCGTLTGAQKADASGSRGRVYTASLAVSAVPIGELLLCEALAGTGAAVQTRREHA
jgi:serine/threonine protein kinase